MELLDGGVEEAIGYLRIELKRGLESLSYRRV